MDGFFEILQGIGGLAFVVALVVVAVQYRHRQRDIRRLKDVNELLARELAVAQARIDEMERWHGRSVPPTYRN
jgi:hypothetical protein